MAVVREGGEEGLEVFVQKAVALDAADEGLKLTGGRELTVDQQPGNLKEGGVSGQLLNRVLGLKIRFKK